MAPLEPNVIAQSNSLPLALFSGQALLVTGLTLHILRKARRAARSLPPSTATRAQEPVRRRHVVTFATLAFLSLASVTTFAIMWRVMSYLEWAEQGNHESPGSLWTGWYGTGEEGVGRWRLGDWLSDTDLIRESDAVAVAMPETFLYTSQHFVALVATATFVGVEGRRRNLTNSTIASFVTLSALGSLSYALNLFFVIMLYTPLAEHSEERPRHDALYAPKPAVFYVPVLVSLFALHTLPGQLEENKDVILLRWGYFAVPLFLAFAPQVIPLSWGQRHATKASAHRSYARAFYVLSLSCFTLYWKVLVKALLVRTPQARPHVYDLLMNSIGKQTQSRPNRLLTGIQIVAQRLKPLSLHPAVSVTTFDVLFTTVSLLAWAFIRDLDVEAMLESSILSFLVRNQEKHVSFEGDAKKAGAAKVEPEEALPGVTPKKRGRPRKTPLTNGDSPSGSTGTLRRSTRHRMRSDYGSEGEEPYEPTSAAARAITQTETDGATTSEDLVRGGEATGLGLFLWFVGGLGQVAASVLGAEVTKTGA